MITRITIVVLLLTTFNLCYGQDQTGNIHVRVLDSETNQPVVYATVYLSQTTIGGYTNDHGEVDISKIPFGTHTLVISEVGHSSQQRKLIIKGPQTTYITVKLPLKMLNEVQVVAKHDRKWRHQLKRFEKMFFGQDHFRSCNILNQSALQFKQEGNEFIVDAKEPLKISNDYLGYNLDFTLKNCFFNAEKFTITGNVRFEEKTGSEKQLTKWKLHREKDYQGSAQHFLHTAIDSLLHNEGYKVFVDITGEDKIVRGSTLGANIGVTILPDTLTKKIRPLTGGMYAIDLPERTEVHYIRKKTWSFAYTDIGYAVSWIEVKKQTPIIVSRRGIVQNQEDFTLVGAMSNRRVADWLPMNYNYKEEFEPDPVVATKKRYALLEKPYIQTDRDYYYNGETIWIKGYMSYTMPMLKDTLSQTVYVELSDSTGKTVAAKRYHLEDGKFKGDIPFEKTWTPGLYQLRAYTAWMMNFDKGLIFTKTIDLLGDREAVRMIADYRAPTDTLLNISLQTDKRSYSTREKITLKIDVTDSLEFSTASDLSISVTDLNQAVPHRNEKTILKNYVYNEKNKKDSTTFTPHDIEYGIPFRGQFWLKSKNVQATLTMFQDSLKDSFGIITEEDGSFKKDLIFNDTVNFYVRAVDVGNNKRGLIVMDTSRVECPKINIEPLALDVYLSGKEKKERDVNLKGATMLQEFSIKRKRINLRPTPARMIGSGDYTVTGDWINDHNYLDIFWALVARVPGLIYDPSLPSIGFMSSKFSSMNGGGGGLLVVLDGQVVYDLNIVLAIPARMIDYLDVLKYGATAKYGVRGSSGVLEIYTKRGGRREDDKTFDKNALQKIKWVGYSTASVFDSPDYNQPVDNDYYDYRPTIFWSPSVVTDGKDPATVSFYAADIPTKYRIVVEGLTAGGIPVRAEKIVDVVSKQ